MPEHCLTAVAMTADRRVMAGWLVSRQEMDCRGRKYKVLLTGGWINEERGENR